ncbi:hornerin-like [Cydia pomonella]|uniref:hornerin-like n=1 Tax=Cydia pomonella TaxID=82600 RepID=UPI002ADD496B|nr:hornerin-like [Cydia pomonella]
MKLFILAALIAVSSAARLEHLEQKRGVKENLASVQSGQGQFGQSSFSAESNDFASQGSNGLDAGDSAGFGSAPHGLRAGSAVARGSLIDAASFNQYLPPGHGHSNSNGAHGQDAFGASSNQFGSQSQFGQNNKFGVQSSSSFRSQGSNDIGSDGSNGFRSQGSNGFSAQGSSFGSQSSKGSGAQGFNGFRSQGARGQNQYLPPKTSHDNIPQQPFDPDSGYIY